MNYYESWENLKDILRDSDRRTTESYRKARWHELLEHPTIFQSILDTMEELERKGNG